MNTPTDSRADARDPDTHLGTSDGGEVSEVSDLEDAQTPIQPDQSVAGDPGDEPGETDEGAQGPNANPNAGASRT